MNTRRPFAALVALLLAGCDSAPKPDPLQAERAKLEAERAALEKEKERIAAEQALEKQKAAAEAESRRIAGERARLEADKAKLAADQARHVEAVELQTEEQKAAQREAMKRAAEQRAEMDQHKAREAEERRKLEILRAKTEAEKVAAERAIAEAKAREADARRAEADAANQRTIAFFYEALAPHGDWLETDRYGFVWRPKRAVVDPNWRPYTDGRWCWTDAGWTWQSLEPYGWAVFHYGRWMRHPRRGWLWVPGHEWAPAWVSWRVKGSEYVGWAPLPPEAQSAKGYGAMVDRELEIGPEHYVFLPVHDFSEVTYLNRFVGSERRMAAIRGSRNVTHLEYRQTDRGRSVVLGGPDPGMIAAAIRRHKDDPDAQPVPRLNLVLSGKPTGGPAGDPVESGALMLYAPRLEKNAPKSKPKEVKDRVQAAEHERGWSGSPGLDGEWRGMVAREAAEAAAAERAAQMPRKQPPATAPKPTPTPTPAPATNAPQRQPARSHPLNPARLQPAGPLGGLRNN